MTDDEIMQHLQRTVAGHERVWLVSEPGHDDYLMHWREALEQEHALCHSDNSLDRVRVELHQSNACD